MTCHKVCSSEVGLSLFEDLFELERTQKLPFCVTTTTPTVLLDPPVADVVVALHIFGLITTAVVGLSDG